MRKRTAIAGILCAFLLIFAAGNAWADRQIVLTFLGDCTLGGEERLADKPYSFASVIGREGYGYSFRNVANLLRQDDLTVANLEGVLRNKTTGGADKTYVFRGDTAYTQILTLGSVEAVSLENNHALDYGAAGKANTVQALTDAGIGYYDMDSAYIFEKDGIRIAFLGLQRAYYFTGGDALVAKIKRLREDDDVNAIVVSMHSGEEYNPFHSDGQTKMAYRMIDAGADLVIGHHPHVVQGMEIYQNRLILYSLGNFVFGGNANVRSMQTVIPRITLSFSQEGEYLGARLRIYPANVSGDDSGGDFDNNYQPVAVQREKAQAVYVLLDQDSKSASAPVLEQETDDYREYRWIDANP